MSWLVPSRFWSVQMMWLDDASCSRPDLHAAVFPGGASTGSPHSCRASGHVDPDIFAVGAARKGIEWEVIAVPDLRTQAVRLSDLLAAEQLGVRQAAPQAGTA